MKTIEQIQRESEDSDVYTIDHYIANVFNGLFTSWDGVGYLHNGEKETEIEAGFNLNRLNLARKRFPYVCWYGK